ncbi:MAG: virulence factor SrfC family protein [Desulfovibrionaceae bacterium]
MHVEDQQLAGCCRQWDKNTEKALTWVQNNRTVVGNEYAPLHAELRRARRLFAKCTIAAERKMCVGVFGPSQSGKSYLISALARDAKGTLLADFAGHTEDFISAINPEGGKESTGLVTRFTTTAPAGMPAGFPVVLRLLSPLDVVRVLANTYYADCEHKETPDEQALVQVLDTLEQRYSAGTPASHGLCLQADDIEELEEYINKNFTSRPRVQLLQKYFWQRAALLAPLLPLADLGHLMGLIWNNVPAFDTLFVHLCTALQALDNPAVAYSPLDALIPRGQSIIDVALLKGLGAIIGGDNTAHDDVPPLTLTGATGRTAVLPRALVAALTAEITIYMPEKPDDFFDYTDLLDFPGYRSRLKLENLHAELSREGTLENLYLRGKVAYLFERYCAERELTSMLLCIGPGNQEVQDLPRAVDAWISATHGTQPSARKGIAPALFFVLTKMDMEFEKKKGVSSVESRWSTRLQSSLLDFFGKQHDWPTLWDGEKPFTNLFLLRNPNFKCEAIFSFDGDKETGVRPDQVEYVEEVRTAFVHTPLVQAHFADPASAWEAAMRCNDGGVSLLREKLRPLCNPALKRQQIGQSVSECAARLVTRLSPHWKTDNKEEERAQKNQLARLLASQLAQLVEMQRFGELLRALQISAHQLHELYSRAEQDLLRQEDSQPAAHALIGSRVSAQDILGDIFGEAEPNAPTATPVPPQAEGDTPPAAPGIQDEAARFTAITLRHWAESLHTLAGSATNQHYFLLPEREFGLFVHELSVGATRLRVQDSMEHALRKAAAYGNTVRERVLWKQAYVAADLINAFVDWLGFNPRLYAAAERTILLGGHNYCLFTPPETVTGEIHIDESPAPYDRLWYTDWLRALVHTLSANVDFDGTVTINTAENQNLRDILTLFQQPCK